MSDVDIGASVEECSQRIASIVADYRAEDNAAPSAADVSAWVEQFDPGDRLVVAQETQNVLSKRYVPKVTAEQACVALVEALANSYSNGDVAAMLAETAFLDLQPPGKSQGAMLEMVERITSGHGFTVSQCGGETPKRYVYLDDVLCTGNTLFQNMRNWWLAANPDGIARQDALPNDVKVEYVFLARHERHFNKVSWRFHYDKELKQRTADLRSRAAFQVDNDTSTGRMEFAFPRKEGLLERATAYFEALGSPTADVFRPEGMPREESFFISPSSRDRFEKALLTKGLEIIDGLSTHKANMHPLGYTLPSQKSFGFGALFFTWRNVPNNSPLVFWHDSARWTPLFEKRPSAPAFDVIFPF